MTIQEAFNLAQQHHHAGRLQQAEQLYRQVLAQQPNHSDALHLLGVIAVQAGRFDIGVDLMRKAIALAPDRPAYYSNLGTALADQGQLDQAIAAYRAAIRLRPDYADAHNNLGNALKDQGHLEQAVAAYRTAIQFRPDYAEAHSNLGVALSKQGQSDEAIAAYRTAIRLKPGYAMAYYNLGIALKDRGQLDQAIAAFQTAVHLRPDLAEAHFNLGNALMDGDELDPAIASFGAALQIRPDFAEVHNNLGNALRGLGKFDEAIVCFHKALALKPGYAEAHCNLANALRDLRRLDEAVVCYRQALTLKPDLAAAHSNLGVALCEQNQLDQAIASYRHAIRIKPDSAEIHSNLANALKDAGRLDEAVASYRQALALAPECPAAHHSNLLLALQYHPGRVETEQFREAQEWDRLYAEPLRPFIFHHDNDRSPDRRLRIGYVSPDFRDHPVGRFLLPLLAHHDHAKVHIFAYAQAPAPDAMTQRLATCVDIWRNTVGLSDEKLAGQIAQDRIDILVDLAGHTAYNRLLVFARKPAPVQVTWLGYPGTTGLSTMDYRLTDMVSSPPEIADAFYTERLIRLPETYWCYQPPDYTPDMNALPAVSAGQVTFGCLNNFAKVSSATLSAWCQLLRQTPNGRLLLHAREGSHRQKVRELLEREGIDSDRLEWAAHLPGSQYFQLYHRIDIALDTFPYGGGTTTCDALWMGVPVISLAGQTAVSRGGLAILTNVGLTELAAGNPDEYVQITADLAGDLPRLAKLRLELRQRMQASPLMDGPRFARHIESAYRDIWRRWCDNPNATVYSGRAG